MSDVIKAAQADATKAADAALTRASKYAGQATAAAQADIKVSQGFLRRNVWALVAIAVVAIALLAWRVMG